MSIERDPSVWLATDGDEGMHAPWAHALRLALALRGTLTLLHAHPEPSHNPWARVPSPTKQLQAWGLSGAVSVDLRNIEGEPRTVLPQALLAGSPDWLVVGTQRPKGLHRLRHGSMGEFLARCGGATRTLVVPQDSTDLVDQRGHFRMKRIAVPVGGTGDQQPAIDAAVALAECVDGEPVHFVLVHCGSPASLPKLALPNRPGWTWKHEIVPTDQVVGAILEASVRWKAGVIVMHSDGHNSVADALFGSHAERVLRGSPVPVVVC